MTADEVIADYLANGGTVRTYKPVKPPKQPTVKVRVIQGGYTRMAAKRAKARGGKYS